MNIRSIQRHRLAVLRNVRIFSTEAAPSAVSGTKLIPCQPIVYVKGEEMTRYTMQLILDKWIFPNIDTSKWKFYDLSCLNRDKTKDQVLKDVITAGQELASIFKEPTVTPSAEQVKKFGLSKAYGSPNGAMRRGWKGITISRDTIHITGMELGFRKKVVFDRQAVGGEYSAGFGMVGAGKVQTVFTPKEEGKDKVIIDERILDDKENAVVTYHNPLDNVPDMAHHFFSRCLLENVTPYVVTKKTVFKWQEGFWVKMKTVFDEHYKTQFKERGLLTNTNGELMHLISDAATMQIIRWTDGGFGMAAHNYDGDMLTDEVAQVHRSPGFITSNLVGKIGDKFIKEYEASHGTVTDMYEAMKRGEETSLNPLGLVEALIGAMQYSEELAIREKLGASATAEDIKKACEKNDIFEFTNRLRRIIHRAMVEGKGTRDISGEKGLTTEQFVDHVAGVLKKTSPEAKEQLKVQMQQLKKKKKLPVREKSIADTFDVEGMKSFFDHLDVDGNGSIDFEEFCAGMIRIGVYPKKFFTDPGRRPH